MNVVKEIERINAQEMALGTKTSWHDEYKDSAYIFASGLDVELTEGDVITIFSQFGEVVDINMPRDKQTNKPRGFAFLMYEDQRSTVLAVDNFNGAKVLDRTLRVDHVKNYKQLEKGEDGKFKERESQSLNARPELFMNNDDKSQDSDSSHPSIDPEDPMAAYLLQQARSKKRKHPKREGETKEERNARRARKREKKRLKAELKASARFLEQDDRERADERRFDSGKERTRRQRSASEEDEARYERRRRRSPSVDENRYRHRDDRRRSYSPDRRPSANRREDSPRQRSSYRDGRREDSPPSHRRD